MKYVDSINLLLLIAIFYSTSANSTCSFDNKITPNVIAFGRPIGSIKVTWPSVNSSGRPVSYKVYYNKTSMMNHCQYPTTDAFYTAKHCSQNSTRKGIHHECDLTEDYKMLNMDMRTDSLCILISINSASSNETCYSFFKEYDSYSTEPICPAPEDLQVHSSKTGKLTVNWNVSPKFVGDATLKEMSFIIHAKPVGKSTMCTAIETKKLSALAYDFSHKNNTHIIGGLGPCCPYMVTICCAFSPMYTECDPRHVSDPFYVTTAEQEPTRAPQVESHAIQHGNLLVKWKIPSNNVCTDKITAYEIHYWEKQNDNCSSIKSGSIKKYITNRSSDREANITDLSSLLVAHCFCIRMCNHPGCGPWSMVYSVEESEYTLITAKTRASKKGVPTETVTIAITAASLAVIIMILILVLVAVRRRNRADAPRRLEEVVGDLETASDILDSSQSTTEMEQLSDYATA
ncbi:uncharacterized protein LOC116292819 [Actinia tenebrosa]|uniref:Uncharacterized protein LOC116292819 n=1 Tax=Actinia tenebrosa TaxID=6105 RepID=A0A6P8HM19_ACTTE|nr:uncharacterized protein LOC116292819 [Actinia tenebrosa]